MNAGAEPAERRPRLNPFVFPSETTFRFGLLVVAVVGTSPYVWNWIHSAVADSAEYAAGAAACLRLSPARTGALDAEAFGAATDAFSACLADLNRPVLGWMLARRGREQPVPVSAAS